MSRLSRFQITGRTTLRGFLAHLQSNAREQAKLYGAYVMHPDNEQMTPPQGSRNESIKSLWDILRRDLKKVLDVDLLPWGELSTAPTFTCRGSVGDGHDPSPDPFRIRFSVLKQRADRARIKDPSITLLGSWVILGGQDDEQ